MKLPVLVLSLVSIAAAALSSVLPCTAQGWPQRTVKLITPLGPGSAVDIAARLFADRLTVVWGKPVVVENRPGADGFVAITSFINARDDHTLLMGASATFTAHPYLHDKLPYEIREIVPVARISNTLVGIAVPASLQVGSLKDFVAVAEKQPGQLGWAGINGATDFIFAGFLRGAGLSLNKVPYRDGVQAANDLAEGRIQAHVAALAIMRPQVEAGKIRVVAITNRERAPSAPDIPTVRQAGYPTAEFDGLVGLFGPRNMTGELRNRIAADIQTIADDPDLVARLLTTGQLVRPGSADEFAGAIEVQRSQVAAAAQLLGLKPAE